MINCAFYTLVNILKKYFVIVAVLLFAACDKAMYYDYFIINECNENLKVYIETGRNNVSQSIVIQSSDTVLVFKDTGINGLYDDLVEFFFKKITIHKGDKISKVNYIDKELWDFKPTSKSHANSYLTVKPEDFE